MLRHSFRLLLGSLGLALAPGADLPQRMSLDAQWIEWTEITSTNLVVDPALGSADTMEKDYATGDFDHDGDLDVVVARKLPFMTAGPQPNVLLLNLAGVLTDATAALAPGFLVPDDSRDVVAADLDGDTWLDLVVANADLAGTGAQSRLYMNLGADLAGNWLGFVEEPGRLPLLFAAPYGHRTTSISGGDVTGDGFVDLYLGEHFGNLEDRLLINDGNGFFTDGTSLLPTGFAASLFNPTVRIADMNGDGHLDIIKNPAPQIKIAYNLGGGVFTSTQAHVVDSAYSFEVGDLDNDGLNDIYVGQDPQDQFKLNNSPPGSIPVTWQGVPLTDSPLTWSYVGNVHLVDLDGDSYRDALVSDVDVELPGCQRRLAFLRNSGASPTPALSDPYNPSYTPAHIQGTFDVLAADFDGDGVKEILVGHCNGTDLFRQVPLSAPRLKRGDANVDGGTDLGDAMFVLNYLFIGGATPECQDAADVNDDGDINTADPIYLLYYLFVPGSASPPEPFPACWQDRTSDALNCASYPQC